MPHSCVCVCSPCQRYLLGVRAAFLSLDFDSITVPLWVAGTVRLYPAAEQQRPTGLNVDIRDLVNLHLLKI